ncbi:thiol reductant ABC exporter subunit CydC [Williamsia maris]|uniref:ATP-binding cassette, subfamily C, CydC n=1 Tax=Williamsia maris TaxID=72806 RepID=A0ABT1HBP1_9NOCA|nr:thiol reductant ABC exporter subunit CydC [Williamsia maris]MCP2175106.1 ATP-binding cassette, subfamily C, CydC [Williamsia maris]
MSDPLVRALRLLGLRVRPVAKSMMLGAAAAMSALALAGLSAWLITRAWQMPPVLALSVAVTAVRALGISRALLRYLERLATHDLALDAMATARQRLYRALAGGSPSYSVTLRRAEIVSRSGDDIDEVGNALIRGLIPIGSAAVTAVAAVAVMAWISPWAGVAMAAAWVLAGVVAPIAAAAGAARSERDAHTARDEVAEITATLLWHAPELVVAGRRDWLLGRAEDAERRALIAHDRGRRIESAAAAVLPAAFALTTLIACLIAVGMSSTSDATTIGVLILLPLSAFETAGSLIDAGRQLHRSRLAAARVMDLVDGAGPATDLASVPRPSASRPVPPDATPTLRTDGLRWGHPSATAFGPDTDLDVIEPGDRVAVVGLSGCGKTALLLTLAGLLEPIAGTVRAPGGTLDDAVRYFGEDGHVFTTSVRENLLVSRGDAGDAMLHAALDAVGLHHWVAGLPDGLDTVLDSGADAMSAGQRRRLLLARALINPAPVLLLDEPCEHLDRTESDRLHRALLDPDSGLVEPGRTVVLVTHRLPTDIGTARVVDLGCQGRQARSRSRAA